MERGIALNLFSAGHIIFHVKYNTNIKMIMIIKGGEEE